MISLIWLMSKCFILSSCSTAISSAALYNTEQRLAVLYRLTVLYQNLCHFSVKITLYLVHQLHSFHDGKCLPFFYGVTH